MTLPKRIDTHKLESDSRLFFEQLVDDDLFTCRREVLDYGVDLQLELLIDRQLASNVRIHVQLKGHERFEYNGNAVKQEIKVSTLNYLLNHFFSMVAAYSKAEKRVVYRMITKPYLRAINSSWREQKTLMIDLENEFCDEAQKALHASVLERHKILKPINDQIETSMSSGQLENLILMKDKAILESQLITDLNKFGHALVNEGDLPLVRDLLGRISKREIETDLGLLQLQTHFYFNTGDLNNAEACAKRFRRLSEGRTDKNTRFVRLIELSVRRIEETLTYLEKQELLETLRFDESPDYLIFWSDIIKSRVFTQKLGRTEAQEEYERMRIRAQQLDVSIRELVEIQIEADRLSSETFFFGTGSIEHFYERGLRERLGIAMPSRELILQAKQLNNQISQMMADYHAVLERVERSRATNLYVDVLYSYVSSINNINYIRLSISSAFPELGINVQTARKMLEDHIVGLDYCFNFWNYIGDYLKSTKALVQKHGIYRWLGKTYLAGEVATTTIERIDRYDLEALRSEIEQDKKGQRTLKFISLHTNSTGSDITF